MDLSDTMRDAPPSAHLANEARDRNWRVGDARKWYRPYRSAETLRAVYGHLKAGDTVSAMARIARPRLKPFIGVRRPMSAHLTVSVSVSSAREGR